MRLARTLILLSAGVFGLTGLGYLLAPGAMLSVVGIESAATSDFLIRTEGVALLTGSAVLWAAHDGSVSHRKVVLAALAVYYVLGSLVDLVAFGQGVVGSASVPSAVVRVVIGGICIVAIGRLASDVKSRDASSDLPSG